MQTPSELTFLADSLGGLPIMGCSSGSPASRAGLRYGDIVLTVEGVPTPSWAAFFQATRFVEPGRRFGERGVCVRVFRQGTELELSLALPWAARTPRAVLEAPATAVCASLS